MKPFKVLYRTQHGELRSQLVRGESAEIVREEFIAPDGEGRGGATVVSVTLYTSIQPTQLTMAPVTL